jgi:hypothetical protein
MGHTIGDFLRDVTDEIVVVRSNTVTGVRNTNRIWPMHEARTFRILVGPESDRLQVCKTCGCCVQA